MIERTCTEYKHKSDGAIEESKKYNASLLSEIPVFVLLGEPGMGKTTLFKTLAKNENGKYITANDFVVLGIADTEKEKPIFIDALDEARLENGASNFSALRKKIRRLKLTKFRIACRTAEWHYQNDAKDIAAIYPHEKCRIFYLNKLNEAEIRSILSDFINTKKEIDAFLNRAIQAGAGIVEMLTNPLLLKLIVQAVGVNGQVWPDNKKDIYTLICDKGIKEHNSRYPSDKQEHPSDLLAAAGWLSALLLLSNKQSIQLDSIAKSQDSIALDEIEDAVFSKTVIQQALKSKLFENGAPIHRTIAEYLAACYIKTRIENGLSASRFATLIQTQSGHIISNLRGLVAWLAVLCQPLQNILFIADPVAILEYDDLSQLDFFAKKRLIHQLAVSSVFSYRYYYDLSAALMPLVQSDMQDFVLEWLGDFLEKDTRSRAEQGVALLLLRVIRRLPADAKWLELMNRYARSTDNVFSRIGLSVLLQHEMGNMTLAMNLLADLKNGVVRDLDHELLGDLLMGLYPDYISPTGIMDYFYPIKTGNINSYYLFWNDYLAKDTPATQLLDLVTALETWVKSQTPSSVTNPEWGEQSEYILDYPCKGLSTVIANAILLHGTEVNIPRLTQWLLWCFGRSVKALTNNNQESLNKIKIWQQDNISLMKQVIAYVLETQADYRLATSGDLLNNTTTPDMGHFWLEQSARLLGLERLEPAKTCLEMAYYKWENAMSDLTHQHNLDIDLEKIEEHVAQQPRLKDYFDQIRMTVIAGHNRSELCLHKKKSQQILDAKKLEEENKLKECMDNIDQIRTGKWVVYLYHAVHADHYKKANPDNFEHDCLAKWLNNSTELRTATDAGYQAYLKSLDSTAIQNAISVEINGQCSETALICLMAADHLFKIAPDMLTQLEEEKLIAVLMFAFLAISERRVDWLFYVAAQKSDCFVKAWLQLASQTIEKECSTQILYLDKLLNEPKLSSVAKIALPKLLEQSPEQTPVNLIGTMAKLLVWCGQNSDKSTIIKFIAKRLHLEHVSDLEESYLHLAGLYVDAEIFKSGLEVAMQNNEVTTAQVLVFVDMLNNYLYHDYAGPALSITAAQFLFEKLAPICLIERPPILGFWGPSDSLEYKGGQFLFSLITFLRENLSDESSAALQYLSGKDLGVWAIYINDAKIEQQQKIAEKKFRIPTPAEIAKSLVAKQPSSHAEMLEIALDFLKDLQQEIKNSDVNLIHRFWAVDSNGHKPIAPSRPEAECRNVIADWFRPRLQGLNISVVLESQYGGGKRSDINLVASCAGKPEILLPIEIKGQWNPDLWTAAETQLAKQYASEPRCQGYGIYLVLWTGDSDEKKLKKQPHTDEPVICTPNELATRLCQKLKNKPNCENIKVFVLDLSIA